MFLLARRPSVRPPRPLHSHRDIKQRRQNGDRVLAMVLARCCTATITTHPRRLSAPLALRAISAAAIKRDLIKKLRRPQMTVLAR